MCGSRIVSFAKDVVSTDGWKMVSPKSKSVQRGKPLGKCAPAPGPGRVETRMWARKRWRGGRE
jgi:hypothetical protein